MKRDSSWKPVDGDGGSYMSDDRTETGCVVYYPHRREEPVKLPPGVSEDCLIVHSSD